MPTSVANHMKTAYGDKKHPFIDQCLKATLSSSRNWPTTHWKVVDTYGNVSYTTNDKVWE